MSWTWLPFAQSFHEWYVSNISATFENAFRVLCKKVLIFIALGWQEPCPNPASSDYCPEVTTVFEVIPLKKHQEFNRVASPVGEVSEGR